MDKINSGMNGFQIKGLDHLIGKLDHLATESRKDAQLALNDFGQRVERDAKLLVASNSSDEGHLLGSIASKPGNLDVSVVAATYYAAFIEFGTRKFAAAYVSTLPPDWSAYAAQFRGKGIGTWDMFLLSIIGWVKRKGIDSKAAYPIARSIIINGIRPKPFLYPSVNKNLPLLINDLKDIFK